MKTPPTTGTILRANGTQEAVAPADGQSFSLKEMQRIVGGNLHCIYLPSGMIMVINEEGKREGLPLNVRATEMVRKYDSTGTIVGDVLLGSPKLIL